MAPPPPVCHFHNDNTYIGLKLVKGDTSYYGWARVAADENSVTIKDYAYNTVPNQFILAGQIIVGTNNPDQTKSVKINIDGDTISIESEYTGAISIFDSQGKEIYKGNITEKKQTINLSKTSKGIYIVKLNSEKGSFSQKIVIK